MDVLIDSAFEGYIFLLLDMWPVLIVVFVAMSISFYCVLMRRTAASFLLLAAIIGTAGSILT